MRNIVSLSSWSLDLERDPLRIPPRPYAIRGPGYEEAFDFTTVFCDCFWDAAGERIILVGPPLLNLRDELELVFVALPSRQECRHDIVELDRVTRIMLEPPPGTTGLIVRSRIGEVLLAPQPNLSELFRGRRTLLTLSKNNELIWIKDWIQFHVTHHGCDGVVLYDNESDRYSLSGLASELSGAFPEVQCLVIGWPFAYGVFDGWSFPGYRNWDSVYCQTAMFEHARLRTLGSARSVLNLDIDELVLTPSGNSVFELVEGSLTGHMLFDGVWVEGHRRHVHRKPQRPFRHKDYYFVQPSGEEIAEPKWAVVPSRSPADVQWRVNSIIGMPASPDLGQATLRHFKAVSTNWAPKPDFAETSPRQTVPRQASDLEIDGDLRRALLSAALDLRRRQAVAPQRPAGHSAEAGAVAAAKALRAGRVRDSVDYLERATGDVPQHPGMLDALSGLLADSDPCRSQELERQAEFLRQSDPWFNLQRGRWLADAGESASALTCFDKAIEADVDLFHAYSAAYRLLSSEGSHQAGIDYLERYLAAHPGEAMAHVVLAEALLARNQYGRAAEHLNTAIALEPTLAHARLQLGRCLADLGDLDGAETAIREGIERLGVSGGDCLFAPPLTLRTSPWAVLRPDAYHLALGDVQLRKGELASAEANVHRAIALGADGAKGWLMLADICSRTGRAEEASAARDTAVAAEWRTSAKQCAALLWSLPELQQRRLDTAYLQQSRVLLRVGRKGEAVDILRARLQRSPDNPRLLIELAKLHRQAGSIEEAGALLQRAMELQPGSADARTALGKACKTSHRDQAIEATQTALRLEPRNTGLVSSLAQLLSAAGRPAEAAQLLREAIEFEPRHSGLLFQLSRTLDDLGKPDEAMSWAQKAATINPYSLNYAQYVIGRHLDAGSLDEAEALLQRAIAIHPEVAVLHHCFSRLHEARGRLDEAVSAARQAAAAAPSRSNMQARLASLLTRAGQPEQAVEVLRNAVRLHPRHGPLNYLLGRALDRLGLEPQEALAAARRAVAANPERDDFQTLLNRLSQRAGKERPAAWSTRAAGDGAEAADVIWVYWENPPGVTQRPAIIEACLDTMVRNSGCEVVVVSKSSINRYVDELHPAMELLSGPHQADVFRLHVLYRYGGMYLDADTVVLSSLRPLFSMLETYEYVGVDWRPPGLPIEQHSPLSIGIMGPCRPKLSFIHDAMERQKALLDAKLKPLRTERKYPVAWEEILGNVVGPSFAAFPPHALMKDGANSWLSLVGGPKWQRGPLHPYLDAAQIAHLGPAELYTISYSLMPEKFRAMSLGELLNSGTILAELLKRAGLDNGTGC